MPRRNNRARIPELTSELILPGTDEFINESHRESERLRRRTRRGRIEPSTNEPVNEPIDADNVMWIGSSRLDRRGGGR